MTKAGNKVLVASTKDCILLAQEGMTVSQESPCIRLSFHLTDCAAMITGASYMRHDIIRYNPIATALSSKVSCHSCLIWHKF